MRSNCVVLVVALSLSLHCSAQDDAPNSSQRESLTREQAAFIVQCCKTSYGDSKGHSEPGKHDRAHHAAGGAFHWRMPQDLQPQVAQGTRPLRAIILTRHWS